MSTFLTIIIGVALTIPFIVFWFWLMDRARDAAAKRLGFKLISFDEYVKQQNIDYSPIFQAFEVRFTHGWYPTKQAATKENIKRAYKAFRRFYVLNVLGFILSFAIYLYLSGYLLTLLLVE